ncbi:ergothioneine biosynthesis protein EgtB [Sphingomonas paeninsulae]|uniref:Ergothioneine biosynthesis protein EgtB n=1 Tax=Sphingomonas paeninsulae TaxID=2319844 RepID=A0A494TMM2_SPHPE|nr:ergothioneine biosynthesis protein EgtB [Sphingomonas paeninsulae]AYJ86335.1 ergothioneine biosynthesis protein EgtB [Sphingomonas paeninsulae]
MAKISQDLLHDSEIPTEDLAALFASTRARTLALADTLSDADATVQSMPDASPAKWHLAHTTWFLETFVLRDFVHGYAPFDESYHFLFNSYYEGEGERHPRARRGMITRPSLDDIREYREHVDYAIGTVFDALPKGAHELIELGCHHEAQHQELMLTDMLHLFAQNPTDPAVWDHPRNVPAPMPQPLRWVEGRQGTAEIGHDATNSNQGFAFDCEGPRHTVWLRRHALADRLITNSEWQAFIEDSGYTRPDLWLSDGWAWVQAEGIAAPLYWRSSDNGWRAFALDGVHALHPAAPVAHISHYEADAYARWAGARLPTEAEWESAAQSCDPCFGNQLDTAGPVRPRAARAADGLRQMFGDVWQWTGSAFLPYPGFAAAEGAVGEYNGKFMSGQMVLRGASCATPRGSSRVSTRNFFPPNARWQFSGLRLARDL